MVLLAPYKVRPINMMSLTKSLPQAPYVTFVVRDIISSIIFASSGQGDIDNHLNTPPRVSQPQPFITIHTCQLVLDD